MINAPASAVDDALARKIARRILPFLFVCYVISYIDRVNIGFAKLQLLQDLKLDDTVFGVAAGMFFIGYVIFEVPSNLLAARVGVRRTLLRIMVLWGGLTIAQMFTRSAATLHTLRFLLGAAEAGFFPAVVLYLTWWFAPERRGRIMSLFVMAVPVAGAIGGPLAGWIMSRLHGDLGLAGWQWLFLVEGVPAIVLGIAAWFVLDDKPADARWLDDDEKARIDAALRAGHAAQPLAAHAPSRFRDALTNPRVYLMAAIYFCIFMALNAIGFWIPTLLREIGVHRLDEIGWLSGAISTCTALGIVLIGRRSDRRADRRWYVAGCGFASAACFVLLPLGAHSVALTFVLLAVASTGIYGALSLFWTIPMAYLREGAAAGGFAMIAAIGALGGAVSPWLIATLKALTGSLYPGAAVIGALLALGMTSVLWVTRTSSLGALAGEALADH